MKTHSATMLLSLCSACYAQELQWIRKYPDVVSFANTPSMYSGATYGFDARVGKIIVLSMDSHHNTPRNFFYYDGLNFTIADIFNSPTQKSQILGQMLYPTQILSDTNTNSLLIPFAASNTNYRVTDNLWRISPNYIDIRNGYLDGTRFSRVVFDNIRNIMVLFAQKWDGGYQTAEHDGQRWVLKDIAQPNAGINFNMVFDSARSKIVLFGGNYGSSLSSRGLDHNKTFEYDGNSWIEIIGPSPPARHNHFMTYDTSLRKTIMFSGLQTTNPQNGATLRIFDTWIYDSDGWQQVNTNFDTIDPHRKVYGDLIFDPIKKTHVLLSHVWNSSLTVAYLERWELVPTCNQPAVTHQPVDQFVPYGAVVTFFAQANNGSVCNDGVTYQWQRRNPNVQDENDPTAWYTLQDDGTFLNTTTSTLTVQNPTPSIATGYRCLITNACPCYDGNFRNTATNVVNFAISCPSDFNADGGIDFQDVELFFLHWENGC